MRTDQDGSAVGLHLACDLSALDDQNENSNSNQRMMIKIACIETSERFQLQPSIGPTYCTSKHIHLMSHHNALSFIHDNVIYPDHLNIGLIYAVHPARKTSARPQHNPIPIPHPLH